MPSQLRDWPLHISSPTCTLKLTPCSTVRDQRLLTMPDSQNEKKMAFHATDLDLHSYTEAVLPRLLSTEKMLAENSKQASIPHALRYGSWRKQAMFQMSHQEKKVSSQSLGSYHTTPQWKGKSWFGLFFPVPRTVAEWATVGGKALSTWCPTVADSPGCCE